MIEIILASVRQAAEGPPTTGRGSGKKVRICFLSSSALEGNTKCFMWVAVMPIDGQW